MANLYQQIGGGSMGGVPQNIINSFQQFKRTFNGDPKAQVQALLDSGRMSQAQYNHLQSIARQLTGVLK